MQVEDDKTNERQQQLTESNFERNLIQSKQVRWTEEPNLTWASLVKQMVTKIRHGTLTRKSAIQNEKGKLKNYGYRYRNTNESTRNQFRNMIQLVKVSAETDAMVVKNQIVKSNLKTDWEWKCEFWTKGEKNICVLRGPHKRTHHKVVWSAMVRNVIGRVGQ